MAFHVDEKRELNLNPADININTSPGMYNLDINLKEKKTFNVKNVPFGTKQKKKSYFDKKPWEINENRGQLLQIEDELRTLKIEEKKSQNLYNKRLYGVSSRDYHNKKEDKKNRVVSIPDIKKKRSKSVQEAPDPGFYYKDPIEQKIKKMKEEKKAKKLAKFLKKRHDLYLRDLLKEQYGRSPSIPERYRKYGYHRNQGK